MSRLIATSVLASAIIVLVIAPSRSDEVKLSQLSGARINSDWFRYINTRFGVAVDIPTKGYTYSVPVNGSGLGMKSNDGAVTITIYTHFSQDPDKSSNDPTPYYSIQHYFDEAVLETTKNGGTVDYSVKKDDYYVISGRFGTNTYYERLTISPECPDIFGSMRIFHPSAMERMLDTLVSRISKSLRSTCQGEDSLPARRNR